MIITDIGELRKISEEVNPVELAKIVEALKEELLKHNTGIGLSAIQIGISKRVAIVKSLDKETMILYNAKIVKNGTPVRFNESCLSIPGLSILTKRYDGIVWENGDGKRYNSGGIEAVCIQHEIDHWNGKLILDRKYKKRR